MVRTPHDSRPSDDDADATDASSVQLDMMDSSTLDDMGTAEKIQRILKSVRKNRIVILESGLEPDEESKLIEQTMHKINDHDFTGIEIERRENTTGNDGLIGRFVNRNETPSALTIIGPADKVKTLQQDDSLTAIVNPDS